MFTQSVRRAVTIALAFGVVAAASRPASAQSDSAMKKDPMKADAMAKDGMMKDGMAKDGMMMNGMANDVMVKDAMVPHAVNLDKRGVVLHGYDPVAYFAAGKPARGEAKYTATHDGATYRFATASNRDSFTANPSKYAPQFGGYCAMGVALNKKLDVDPAAWRIVDGKLYLNVNRTVQRDWQKDIPGNIAKANTNWPAIRGLAASAL